MYTFKATHMYVYKWSMAGLWRYVGQWCRSAQEDSVNRLMDGGGPSKWILDTNLNTPAHTHMYPHTLTQCVLSSLNSLNTLHLQEAQPHTLTHMYTHTITHTRMYSHTLAHTHACTHTHTHTRMYSHTHTYTLRLPPDMGLVWSSLWTVWFKPEEEEGIAVMLAV